jgi:hypothetical protein
MSSIIGMVSVTVVAVGAALGLEGNLYLSEVRPEVMEHVLNHVVGSNTQNLMANVGRQMPIAQMPGEAHKLSGILMPDFDNELRGGSDFKPPPIL